MSNKQQTAVEWLEEKLIESGVNLLRDEIEFIHQAKQLEKQQMKSVWLDSRIEDKGDDYIAKQKTFEQYYEETYE